MAIATEIGRLQGAKQDLISRLKAKGVSVPENATLEEITPLVDNIPSEDLDSIITELETKVTTLNTTLDGKASGGSGDTSIKTCTVRPYFINGYYPGSSGKYYATVFRNGTIASISGNWDRSITSSNPITDVICGSVFCLYASVKGGITINSGDATLMGKIGSSGVAITMPIEANADVQLCPTADVA